MALTPAEIKATYPLPVYNYLVEVGGVAVAFSEVLGLDISYEDHTYKESPTESGAPGPRVMRMPMQSKPANVTLRKGVVKAVSVPALYEWIHAIQTNQVEKKDIFVRLCDEAGATLISWKIINAFPIRLEAPAFKAASNDAAIESLDLIADGVEIEES
ncbi:MAG: phage tail protein [Acidobacteriota bacterium]